jgi:hypothetical protein
MSDRGTLEKLLIKAYDKPDYDRSTQPIGQFESYVNPSEITLSYEIEYDAAQGAGTTCTGASGRVIDVQKKIEEFQTVTGYNGSNHRPNYLKVAWGTLQVKRCVIKSVSIAYKLFKPDGIPLRAVITAAFIDNSDDQTRVALARDQSPDLTHVRLAKAGDNLPAMCFKIYGDPRYYLDVARANRIDNFRNLVPGTRIFFPPLTK